MFNKLNHKKIMEKVDFVPAVFIGIIVVYLGFIIRTCILADSILPLVIAILAWYGCISAGAGVVAMVEQFGEIWLDEGIFSKIFAVIVPGSFALVFLAASLLAGYVGLGLTGLFEPVIAFFLS